MNNSRPFAQLIEEVDVALAERRHLRQRGVNLLVTHLLHVPGTLCAPGEMIGDIALGGSTEPLSLGLAHMSLLLIDCFCRYRMSLTASKIEEIMKTDPFYLRYGANRSGQNRVISRPDRNTVRVYIPRIHERMEQVFQSRGLYLDPRQILVAEQIDGATAYRLKATVEFVHVDKK